MEVTRQKLIERAKANICSCFRTATLDDLTDGELKEIINSSYYLHVEAGENWNDCSEWYQDRLEVLAETAYDEMRDYQND
jgi:hypothetical protein